MDREDSPLSSGAKVKSMATDSCCGEKMHLNLGRLWKKSIVYSLTKKVWNTS